MKPLILSFFAVILFYSLFLDRKEGKEVEPTTTNTPSYHLNQMERSEADSVVFYANRYIYDFKLKDL